MIAQPIPLTTLQDILDVESDADFEQIVLEQEIIFDVHRRPRLERNAYFVRYLAAD